MKSLSKGLLAIAVLAAVVVGFGVPQRAPAAPRSQSDACAIPTVPTSNMDETAWRLFVALHCKGQSGQYVWEDWIEQDDFYPVDPSAKAVAAVSGQHRLHGSVLDQMRAAAELRAAGIAPPAKLTAPNQGCRPIHKFKNRLPDNVKPGGVICEESRLNPAIAHFIQSMNLDTRTGQVAALAAGMKKLVFPDDTIEVKVMWIPSDSLVKSFDCAKGDPILYTETIGGKCYAMVGMHIMSRILPNWLWATFEVKDVRTNPLRCIWFGPCRDSWGATPATSDGGKKDATMPTQALLDLMQQAGLPKVLQNMRLVGTQTEFITDKGKNVTLGNSAIEGEGVGMLQNRSSCMTCHAFSSVGPKGQEVSEDRLDRPGFIGPPHAVKSGWLDRSFVWSLEMACPDPPKTAPQDRRCKVPPMPPM